MQYRSGVCSVTNGSAIVTISLATEDASRVAIGDQFKLDLNGDPIYQVASRTPSSGPTLTSLTLTAPYGGADAAGVDYQIVSDFSVSRGYPLLAQGDLDSADWLKRIVTMIDSDIEAILGASGVPSLTDGMVIYKSADGFADSNIYYNDAVGGLGIGTTSLDANAILTVKGGAQALFGYQLALEEAANGGDGVGIAFRHIDSVSGTKLVAAKIVSDGDSPWDSASNRTSRLSFHTMFEGTLVDRVTITGKGAVLIGATLYVGMDQGEVGLWNNKAIKGQLADGSGYASLIKLDVGNVVTLDPDGQGVRFGESLKSLGGEGTATLGTVGGDGPASTSQYAWRRFVSDDGGYEYHPVFR